MADGDNGAADSKSNSSPGIEIELNGEKKIFTADDVKNLVGLQAQMTPKAQLVSEIEAKARALNLDPQQFVEQSVNAFGTLASLYEQGLIDDEGNFKAPKQTVQDPGERKPTVIPSASKSNLSVEQIADQALEKVAPHIKNLTEENLRLRGDLNSLARLRLEDDLTKRFPELSSEDVSKVLAISVRDKQRDLFQIAKGLQDSKVNEKAEIKKQIGKHYGIDFDTLDANRLLQEKGGGASALVQGKAISFRKGQKDAVDPRDAALQYLNRIGS